ncbi:MAG TPA: phosphodiester glycosidase family protein, partial [Polyangiaceae bacterium]
MSRSRRLSLSFAAAAFAALVPSFASAQTVSKPAPGVTLVSDGTHAMTVADLCAPGVRIRATEYGERKATPEEWATKPTVNAVAAVNGDFFDFPGWTIVHGMARGGGQPWPAAAQLVEGRHHFLFGPHYSDLQKDTVAAPATTVASDIIGCHNVIVSAGKSLAPNFDGDSVILGSYRRTAIGISKERDAVYLFASDQALSGAQLASYVLTYAAKAGHPDVDVACNMDGGGSSQMYVKGHGQIVTSGREVNNHLGIIATGSGDAPMCPNHPSHGYLDSADCTKGLAGWAQDPDAPSSSIHVDAYYDGVPGAAGATGVRLEADVDRSDLLKAIGSTNHGYTMDLPLSLYDSKQHTVYAYA